MTRGFVCTYIRGVMTRVYGHTGVHARASRANASRDDDGRRSFGRRDDASRRARVWIVGDGIARVVRGRCGDDGEDVGVGGVCATTVVVSSGGDGTDDDDGTDGPGECRVERCVAATVQREENRSRDHAGGAV